MLVLAEYMENIIGRYKEIEVLNKSYNSTKSEFVAIYGRRRVGKTFLIRQTFSENTTFQLTGVNNATSRQQLANFYAALTKQQGGDFSIPKNWFDAFQQLITVLEKSADTKKVIFLDELPWLDTPKSDFLIALEHFWNSWASARNDVLLIVCGSSASWILNKLINNKGGLHNRVTVRIKLDPFNLLECEAFFQAKSCAFTRYQLLELYMVFGGIPFYLDQVDAQLSATQNINKLCFEENSFFRIEYKNLYDSLFKNADNHVAVIETLAQKAKGMKRNDLIKASKLANGGTFTKVLQELEDSGFIRKYIAYGKKSNESIYQLTDFYSIFYLKFIRDSDVLDERFWMNNIDSPNRRAWSGFAFERVCLSHIREIKQTLGVGMIQTSISAWQNENTQIDLLIDRRDQVINLCEMKFSINPFTIDKKYAENLGNKISSFREASQTRKAIYLTMITTFGLAKNDYSSSMVQNELTMDALFVRLM
jgi:uncharacterized protein